MKLKCIAELPDEAQARRLGKYYRPGQQTFRLTVGREYLVYGLSFLEGEPWAELLAEFGYLYSAPLCLFEVVDHRVSRHWEVRRGEEGSWSFWPRSFSREYYFDDLVEGVQDVVDDFRWVRRLIETEADGGEPDDASAHHST